MLLSTFAAGVFLLWFFSGKLLPGSRSNDKPLTAVASRGELKITITDRGELESIDSVQVTCELEGGGKLVSILPEGARVKKGDEVAKLDTDLLSKALNEQQVKCQQADGKKQSCKSELSQAKNKAESEIAKADLALTLAKIDLESFEHPKGEYQKDLEKLKGAHELARKELKESEDDLAFTRDLVKKGFAQLDQIRAKELGLQQRKNQVASAEAELTVLELFTKKKKVTELKAKAEEAMRELARTKDSQKSLIEKAESELKAATSTAEIEKGELTRIEKQIERCTIRAPSEGIVVYSNSRYWDETARIRPGAQLYYRQEIFTLPDLSRMQVKMKVHETVIKKVTAELPATIQIEAIPNRPLGGKVKNIATIAQADGWRGGGVKQYQTIVTIDEIPTDAGLKPGMTAEVKILVATLPNALSVPVTAVTEYEGARVVYVPTRDGFERREVSLGETNDQFVQILDGLQEGDTVTLDARRRAGADMKATTAKKTPK